MNTEELKIENFNIETCLGKITPSSHNLYFLSDREKDEFNNIGYIGKDLNGNKITREEYLNSLDKGKFKVKQTKIDNGDFSEEFFITRVTKKEN